MNETKTQLAEDGTITLPDEYLQVLGLHVGDEVILRLEGGEIHVFTPKQSIKRAQELVRRYVPENRSLADELVAERRLED